MKIGILLSVFVPLLFGAVSAWADNGAESARAGVPQLERFMGTWYEIARFDHRFERGLWQVQLHCRMLSDGLVDVESRGMHYRTGAQRRVKGRVRVAGPGRLRISFRWFFYRDCVVLELDEAGRWALIGGRKANCLWILSRSPELSGRTLNRILRMARRRGYATRKLLYVGSE